MNKYARTKLFFLKQYGFSSSLLEQIFLLGKDPEIVIFRDENINLKHDLIFTKKDKKLAVDYNKYETFKFDLFKDATFHSDIGDKMYFKYDENSISELIPEKHRPLFMYSKGKDSLLEHDRRRVAIVGTRKPSNLSVELARKISKKIISNGDVIVSGLAEGIDTVSHKIALENKGDTIAVLPTNFKKIYPSSNKQLAKEIIEKGLVLTSIGPKENTYKSSFLERNQYVANMSDIVVVIETNLKSGTMNTIKNAYEAGKEILFVEQSSKEVNKKIHEYGGKLIDG